MRLLVKDTQMKGDPAFRLGERTVSTVNVEVKIELGHFYKGNLRMHTKAFCTGRPTFLLARNIPQCHASSDKHRRNCVLTSMLTCMPATQGSSSNRGSVTRSLPRILILSTPT